MKQIVEEYKQAAHPEKAYLNDFESSLEGWLKETLGKDERMVIFIDDLDRCLPEVALKVLEALKLYLNIPDLIFVLGVDKEVINPLVREHYEKLGLKEYKSKDYLAKMFQVEVELAPSERQVEKFLESRLGEIAYWEENLDEEEKGVFEEVIKDLAGRNPREVKRLINSSLIAGAGAEKTEPVEGETKEGRLSFAQGMQVFLVRKILDEQHKGRGWMVGSENGDAFFRRWSKIVRKNKDKENFPFTLEVPDDYETEDFREKEGVVTVQGKKVPTTEKPLLSITPEEYHGLLQESRFKAYLVLLTDRNLGRLMLVEYPLETALVASLGISREDDEIIQKVIAEQLGKEVEVLTTKDYEEIEKLNLEGQPIKEVGFLRKLVNLKNLILSGTLVTDIEPLKGLINLQWLSLRSLRICKGFSCMALR